MRLVCELNSTRALRLFFFGRPPMTFLDMEVFPMQIFLWHGDMIDMRL